MRLAGGPRSSRAPAATSAAPSPWPSPRRAPIWCSTRAPTATSWRRWPPSAARPASRVVTALADVGDAGAVEAMVTRGLAELGALDVLVCNAAIRPHKAMTETSVEEWHRVLGVNLHSAFYLSRAVVPAMKARKRGSIIALGGLVEPHRSRRHGGGDARPRPGCWASSARWPPSWGRSASAPTWSCRASSTPSAATPSGIPSSGRRRPARPSSSSKIPLRRLGPARGHRRRLRVPRLRRVELRHRRHHPGHGRPLHRLIPRVDICSPPANLHASRWGALSAASSGRRARLRPRHAIGSPRCSVEERRSLTAQEFLDIFSLCNFLPGPNIVNVSVVVGPASAASHAVVASSGS